MAYISHYDASLTRIPVEAQFLATAVPSKVSVCLRLKHLIGINHI